MFALWGQIDWKYWFWKIWVEFKCFWKTFRLILMHFFIKQCALRSFYIKMLCFSKIWFFQTFDWSNLIFDKSKLRIKISMRFYMFRLIETIFRSIEYRESGFFFFFLNSVFDPFKTLFQKFFQLFSLSSTWQSKIFQFWSFSFDSFARFSSPKATPCLGKLELIWFPLLLLCLPLGFSFLRTIVVVRLLRN